MADIGLEVVLVFVIIVLIVGILYAAAKSRRREVSGVVIIREGRLPGEPASGITCRNCGRRFKHTVTFEGEVVKCPYCGSEVS